VYVLPVERPAAAARVVCGRLGTNVRAYVDVKWPNKREQICAALYHIKEEIDDERVAGCGRRVHPADPLSGRSRLDGPADVVPS